MKKAGALMLVLVGACQGGLPVDQGNDFPCDFSQPEEVRDEACSPGEVCGVDNLCRHFEYEGPQFEGPPSLPEYDQGLLLHPLVFDRPVRAVAAEASGKRELVVALGQGVGALSVRAELAPVLQVTPTVAVPEGVRELAWGEKLDRSPDLFAVTDQAVGKTSTDLFRDTQSFEVRDSANVRFDDGRKLRAGSPGLVVLRATATLPPVFQAGELSTPYALRPVNGLHLELTDLLPSAPTADGGTVAGDPLEARYVPSFGLPNRDELLVLTSQGFFLRTRFRDPLPAESWRVVSPEASPGFASLAQTAPGSVSLRHDSSGSVWAFSRPTSVVDQRQQVLSVWSMARTGQPSMGRTWADCSPCREGRIVSFAPRLEGAPSVEVVCATGSSEGLSLVEVVGSAAPDPSQDCLTRSVAPAFALNELNRSGQGVVEDQSLSGQVVLGGRHGQLWGGESFSTAYPFTLERIPQGFGTLQLDDGTVVPVALTDRYPAAPLVPGIGFQAFNLQRSSDSPLPPDVAARAMVGLAQGWFVLSTGDVAQLQARADGGTVLSRFRMQFGPRLVDARGAPARAPFFGEGVRDFADGGLVSMVLAADDSLYLLPVPQTTPAPETLPPLTPQLTPEPGSPIRSFALERSTVGTDGVNKVRGYVVTSRSLYTVQLAGTPARWSATPVLLAGGEPVETWMDHPLGGLGRVGYRDGQVFTLPGGFLLVNPLPKTDGGTAVQVTDFENLAGWPVAMATSGLYVAEYGLTDAGRLDNKFPDGTLGKAMNWREVSLPDGGRPWLGEAARLQVVPRGALTAPDGGVRQEVFSLLVYTGQQVWQVAQLKRRCSNCASVSP